MKFRIFQLFYFLAIPLTICGFVIGLWPFFITASIVSLLTGIIYYLFFKAGRHISNALIIVHFILAVLGLLFSLNIFRAFSRLADSGAPDTMALSSGLEILLGPLMLLAALVIFIIALLTGKK